MYSINKINISEAVSVWNNSPNANAYNNPELTRSFKNISYYAVSKGKEILCCWPIHIKKNNECQIPDLFYYFGPFWSNKIKDLPEHSWMSYSLNVYEFFIKEFTKKFKKITFELHYSLNDVRIFDWWNYDKSSSIRFKIYPRYTALIDNLKNKSEIDIVSDYRYSRRYELKKFSKLENEIVSAKIDINEILKLYFKIVKVNNIIDKNQITENIKIINKLSKKKLSKVFAYKSKKTNELICVTILIFDKISSHLILSIATEEWKRKGVMTWILHKSIMYTKERALDIFDFNGANSPKRGDHKHSFGSKTKLFFKLNYG